MTTNKHGLSRRIPTGIKRRIRQGSGFGCVICGFAIYQYEHVDPEFVDATCHNPKSMTLLCGSCHDQVTRGIYSKEKVKEAMLNPKCKQKGFTFGAFDIGRDVPSIQFGSSLFTSQSGLVLFEIEGEDLLAFEPPEIPSGPFLLSASLYDKDEKLFFSVEKNEWKGDVDNWDIEIEGRRITIRQKNMDVLLELINIPRKAILINKINIQYKGYKIFGNDANKMTISGPSGGGLSFETCIFEFDNKPIRNVGYQLGQAINPFSRAVVRLT